MGFENARNGLASDRTIVDCKICNTISEVKFHSCIYFYCYNNNSSSNNKRA